MKGDRRYELGDGKLVPSEISGNENELEVCSLFVCSFLTFFFSKAKKMNLLLGIFLVLACGACVHAFHNLPLSHERVETAGQLKHLQTIGFSSLKQKALTNSTIDGNILPLGIYWTPVYLGVPVRGPFQLAIDTGSTDLMVPGVGCDGCVTEVTSPYDPSQSAGYTPLTCATTKVHCKGCLLSPSGPCRFLNSYETCDLADPTKSCTIEGPLITDQAGFSDSQSATTDMVLGVIMNQTSNFQQLQYIDGIVGFSFPGSSAFGYHSLFQSLFTAGIYSENVFAMCLTPNHGGILTLGGTDPTLYSGSIPWTPVVSTRSFTLTFSGIQVEGTALSVPSGTVIIDSGLSQILLFLSLSCSIVNFFIFTFFLLNSRHQQLVA